MKLIHGDGGDWSDDEVQDALRAHYAAPVDDSYWASLERRILTRVRAEGAREWWTYFPGWVRFGVAAAAVAALVVGIATWQTSLAQERIAYEEILGPGSEVPILTESVTDRNRSQREQTLRYLLTH
jgi:anti-sigma-K factor RskA